VACVKTLCDPTDWAHNSYLAGRCSLTSVDPSQGSLTPREPEDESLAADSKLLEGHTAPPRSVALRAGRPRTFVACCLRGVWLDRGVVRGILAKSHACASCSVMLDHVELRGGRRKLGAFGHGARLQPGAAPGGRVAQLLSAAHASDTQSVVGQRQKVGGVSREAGAVLTV
jgi:hypothetical protein